MNETVTIHRVPDGSGALTANCGADLLEPRTLGFYGDDPSLTSGQERCTRGCYPKHRAPISRFDQSLRDMSVPLVPARHSAGVAA